MQRWRGRLCRAAPNFCIATGGHHFHWPPNGNGKRQGQQLLFDAVLLLRLPTFVIHNDPEIWKLK